MDNIFRSVEDLIYDKLNLSGEELTPFNISREKIESLVSHGISSKTHVSQKIEYISYLFNLDDNEKSIVTALFLFEVIPNYDKVFAFLNGDINRNYPTIGTFSNLLSNNGRYDLSIYSYFSEERPLLKFGIINIDEEEVPLAQKSVKIDKVIKRYLLNQRCLELKNSVSLSTIGTPNYEIIDKDTLKVLDNPDIRFMFNLTGKNRAKKELFSFSVASIKDLELIVVKPEFFKNKNLTQIDELFKSSFFDGCCLFFKEFESIRDNDNYEDILTALKENIQKFSWAVFFDTEDLILNLQIDDFVLIKKDFKYPSAVERAKIWKKYINIPEEVIKNLSVSFKLDEEQIKTVCKQISITGLDTGSKKLFDLCKTYFGSELGKYAEKIDTEFSFDDIVLPEEIIGKLKMIPLHYKHQIEVFDKWNLNQKIKNRSITALFTGRPGTGKSMAASIVANEIGLDMYRIDLSKVMSKYIGETEKILSEIFNSAENAGCILFFDEADAVFGKRTEIKDAHDRFSNIEISYLLQRIESYDGIVILATNLKRNIDDAFMRRMRFIVDFPFPSRELRFKIWQKSIPAECPLSEDIDFKKISNVKMTGGNIKNAVLYAAFLAKERGVALREKEIYEGIKIELQKYGKLFNKNTKEDIEDLDDEAL